MDTKELAKTADAWFKAREKRLAADKVAAELKKTETELADKLIANLAKDTTGISGRVVRVYVEAEEVPQIKDRAKFMAYVTKHKAWEMIPSGCNKKPWRERVEDGKKIPGIDTVFVPKLHHSKL